MPEHGWYQNPADPPGTARWWDGNGWSEHTRRSGQFDDDFSSDDFPSADSSDDRLDELESPRRRLVPVLLALLVLMAAGAVVFLVSRSSNGGDTPSVQSPPNSVTTVPAASAPSVVTGPPAQSPPFVSSHGWTFQAGPGWVTIDNQPDAPVVLWLAPGGAMAGIEVSSNSPDFAVTADSVRSGIEKYLEESFGVSGPVAVTETTMGGRWAIHAQAQDAKTKAVLSIGSSDGHNTVIVSLKGSPSQVDEALGDFETAVAGFTYN